MYQTYVIAIVHRINVIHICSYIARITRISFSIDWSFIFLPFCMTFYMIVEQVNYKSLKIQAHMLKLWLEPSTFITKRRSLHHRSCSWPKSPKWFTLVYLFPLKGNNREREIYYHFFLSFTKSINLFIKVLIPTYLRYWMLVLQAML